MVLILLCTFSTIWICVSQVARFINGPIVVTLEKDYRNWVYKPMAITICTDYLNENATDVLMQRFSENFSQFSIDDSRKYRDFFHIIGSLNAENLDLIRKFENTNLFSNLTGEDLLTIATEVLIWKFNESIREIFISYFFRWKIRPIGILNFIRLWPKQAYAIQLCKFMSTSGHRAMSEYYNN